MKDSMNNKPAPKTETLNKAAALKYDGKNAPTVVAKGIGSVAQKIIDIADENNIHIHNDPLLLEVLSKLELGEEIPEQLYLAVAKIIAFAYFLQGKHPNYSHQKMKAQSEQQSLLSHVDSSKNIKPEKNIKAEKNLKEK